MTPTENPEGDKPEDDIDSVEVPKLPRGRLFAGVRPIEFIRIGSVAIMLTVVIVAGGPCADGVAQFVESFAPAADAGPPPPELKYQRLTEEQIRKNFGEWRDAGPTLDGAAATDSSAAATPAPVSPELEKAPDPEH